MPPASIPFSRRLPARLLLVFLLPLLAAPAATARTITDTNRSGETFAGFFSRQSGRVFTGPAYSQRGQTVRHLYVSEQEYGQKEFRDPQVRYQPHVDGRDVEVHLAYDRVTVEDRTFRYADAQTFENETAEPDHPMYADLHVAPRLGNRPTLFCIESRPDDADTAPLDMPLFLLVAPLSPEARLYRLPGRYSSCAAVTASAEGTVSFPSIRELAGEDGAPVGVRIQRYRIDGDRFVDSGRSVSATFVDPGDVPRFVMDAP